MKILNFGSLNIDHVYAVDHFVRPGETLSSKAYRRFSGGKGANQSVALGSAGAPVWHAGKIGADGLWLKQTLEARGVNTNFVEVVDCPTGHAFIQVTPHGENAIVIYGGANHRIAAEDARRVLSFFGAGDRLLVQNEITAIPEILREAARRKMKIAFNPAPMSREVHVYPLELVDVFIVNEIEGAELTSAEEPHAMLKVMAARFPHAGTVITLGAKGAIYGKAGTLIEEPGVRVAAVDTTGAGDTFVGYFLAELAAEKDLEVALRVACHAAALCVTRPGAADSIPLRSEVEAFCTGTK